MKNKFTIIFRGFISSMFLFFISYSSTSYGQSVGISATGAAPAGSAMLDIVSSDKGLLIPRVALISTTDPIAAPTTSLLVYNTSTSGTYSTPGYYYYNGSNWVMLQPAGGSSGWGLSGNASTTPGTGVGQNFVGTTDAKDLVIATNGTNRMNIGSNGNVGIGNTANSAALLDVASTSKGAVLPRMSKANRDAISSPPAGLIIYQTDGATGYYSYTGSAWKKMTPDYYSSVGNTDLAHGTTYTNFEDMTGMSITLTPASSIVYLTFSCVGGITASTTLQNRVTFIIMKDGVQVGKRFIAPEMLQSSGVPFSSFSCTYSIPITVTEAVPTTIKIQWAAFGNATTTSLNCNASTALNHSRILTIVAP